MLRFATLPAIVSLLPAVAMPVLQFVNVAALPAIVVGLVVHSATLPAIVVLLPTLTTGAALVLQAFVGLQVTTSAALPAVTSSAALLLLPAIAAVQAIVALLPAIATVQAIVGLRFAPCAIWPTCCVVVLPIDSFAIRATMPAASVWCPL